MENIDRTWLDVFKKYFVQDTEVSSKGIMPWNLLNEFEATVPCFKAYVCQYKVDNKMGNAYVSLSSSMVDLLKNEVNSKK